ncbi:hypothetical protein ACFSJ3_08975 [Corallincola platygyrae]|uniref:DUF2884 family protein n=1 Tax=Corallincola platygyrae TaxID=1193278 RepID=A0ABW4XNS1_9GAMM
MNLFSMATAGVLGTTLAMNSALAGGDDQGLRQLRIDVIQGNISLFTQDKHGARQKHQLTLADACDDVSRTAVLEGYDEATKRRLDKLIKLHSCERDDSYRISFHEIDHPRASRDMQRHYLQVAERMEHLSEHLEAMGERISDHMEQWAEGWEMEFEAMHEHGILYDAMPMPPLPPEALEVPELGEVYTQVIIDLLADGSLTEAQKAKIGEALAAVEPKAEPK